MSSLCGCKTKAHNADTRRTSFRPTVNAVFKTDPSRTLTLRRRFAAQMDRRFRALKRDIQISILDRDCFGIQPDVPRLAGAAQVGTNVPTGYKAYEFKRAHEKVQSFMAWLEEQEKAGILTIIRRPGVHGGMVEVPWTDVFIDSAYTRGIRRGRAELRAAGYTVPNFEATPGGIGALMNQPHHAERVAAIYSRTFEDLKTVTREMDAQVRRRITDGLTTGLARGLAEGKNPRAIARELVKDVHNRVDKIGITRARMIARTEVIRAHHVANIAEYEQADADMDVTVMAEWSTAGYEVCPVCIDKFTRNPWKLKDIEGEIPAHPNCTAASTLIDAQDILAGLWTTYSGSIVELVFANDARLTVTPNHMLATPYGFVMAKFLSEGDTVLSGPRGQRFASCDPDDHRNPSRIDNRIGALAETFGVTTMRVPVAAEHVHGDGRSCKGDINIVNINGFLGNTVNSHLSEAPEQPKLHRGGEFEILSGNGDFASVIDAMFSAPDRRMGISREGAAFLRGCLRHAKVHGFAPIAGSDSVFCQTTRDDVSLAAKMLSYLLDGVSRTVSAKDLFDIYLQSVGRTSFDFNLNASLENPIFDGVALSKPIGPGNLSKIFSGQVTPMGIKSIEFRHCNNLRVYDLSTSATVYFGNGVLSSNCRCVAIPVIKEKGRKRIRK